MRDETILKLITKIKEECEKGPILQPQVLWFKVNDFFINILLQEYYEKKLEILFNTTKNVEEIKEIRTILIALRTLMKLNKTLNDLFEIINLVENRDN